MNTIRMIKTNRFWQVCQRFDFAQRNDKHEIETDTTPQAGGSAA